MTRINLIGISGSLRAESYNTRLLQTVQRLLPDNAHLAIEKLDGIPLFNEDRETPQPATVSNLRSSISHCDGLIVCTPEYNLGIPGVLKNAFDWFSRPPQEQPKVLHGKLVLLMGASPGPFGTVSAQNACLSMFRALRMPVWNEQGLFVVAHAGERFVSGRMADDALEQRLQQQVDGYCRHLRQFRPTEGN